jgi:hypothetical protein
MISRFGGVFGLFSLYLSVVRPGCGCEEVVGMCVLLSCGGRVGFLFLLVRFFFCSVLRSVSDGFSQWLSVCGWFDG